MPSLIPFVGYSNRSTFALAPRDRILEKKERHLLFEDILTEGYLFLVPVKF